MTSLIEKLIESPDAKTEVTYDLVKKAFDENLEF